MHYNLVLYSLAIHNFLTAFHLSYCMNCVDLTWPATNLQITPWFHLRCIHFWEVILYELLHPNRSSFFSQSLDLLVPWNTDWFATVLLQSYAQFWHPKNKLKDSWTSMELVAFQRVLGFSLCLAPLLFLSAAPFGSLLVTMEPWAVPELGSENRAVIGWTWEDKFESGFGKFEREEPLLSLPWFPSIVPAYSSWVFWNGKWVAWQLGNGCNIQPHRTEMCVRMIRN